jgi:phage tail sheath protein FI
VPASVAALSALGFNDKVSYPWFAPAGFNRAALDFVSNVAVRLNVADRDALYEARINPIATFPRLGYVIYGQKTLQINKSALDRVNVRRLLLEVKRIIIGIAQKLVFEQNTPAVRNKFVADASFQLSLIQAQAGIEAFQVVCNESNNTQSDIDLNKLNGRIVVVPTRVVEYIALDFIITNSGVQFV